MLAAVSVTRQLSQHAVDMNRLSVQVVDVAPRRQAHGNHSEGRVGQVVDGLFLGNMARDLQGNGQVDTHPTPPLITHQASPSSRGISRGNFCWCLRRCARKSRMVMGCSPQRRGTSPKYEH